MKVCNDFNSLYKELEKEIIASLIVISEKIKKDIERYIEVNIYDAYSPEIYNRTNELKKSIKVEPVKNIGDEWYIEVYILEEIHKDKSNWRDGQKTFDEIIEYFESGKANWRDNEKIETISIAEKEWVYMGRALKEIKNYLGKKYDVIKF